ncbi:hypothetical protein B0O99DRAFT_597275 [Bisporella sp. PMI_857]|nr:hypothetical protein B0O99DRAFT_597275 [Bisporella sp. PMI_857]
MPRGKRGGGPRGKLYSKNGGRVSFQPLSGAGSSRDERHAFTLADEARNTERHHWGDSVQKLRNSKIAFVSAGTYDPPNLRDALASLSLEDKITEEDKTEQNIEVIVEEDTETGNQGNPKASYEDVIEVMIEQEKSIPPSFVLDTVGTQREEINIPKPQPRSVSPTPSDSSEEVILFCGRKNQSMTTSHSANPQPSPLSVQKKALTVADTIDARIQLVDAKILFQEELLEETLYAKHDAMKLYQELDESSSQFEAILPNKGSSKSRQRGRGRKSIQEHEDPLYADYIANMDDSDELLGPFNQRELGGTSDGAWREESEPLPEQFHSHGGWDRSDLVNFDDLSTSDGVPGEVQAIYSKRERATGLQYLIVTEGQTIDEARWVAATTIAFYGAAKLIDEFEAEERLVAEFRPSLDASEDSDDDMDQDEDELDDELDMDVPRHQLTNKQIARLLRKQEELGMGSHELLLFDGARDDRTENIADFRPLTTKTQSRGRGSRRPPGGFPAATALADAYDGFDVMDFERPSLKRKSRGRKGKLTFDLSDSELEASMHAAWENDRQKKRERKQEREDLRALGLLRSQSGKPNLKEKYKEGMLMHQVRAEIKDFLIRDDTTLELPSMTKGDRKLVHAIANKFGLKSKSVGKGQGRSPILYKTLQTSAYMSRTYSAAEADIEQRFLRRADTGGARKGKRAIRGGGGYSYRDGDVVGGSAPEIGIENKGRAMLEKMGWSSGTALGAVNNKGIMTPVTHIVKNSKAGLG